MSTAGGGDESKDSSAAPKTTNCRPQGRQFALCTGSTPRADTRECHTQSSWKQEVEASFLALPDELFGQAERYIDLLAAEGVHLDEPFTRQLQGKLRELRFHLGRQQTRITYYIATGRRIVLLTVFVKTRQRERLEVQRAWRAMQNYIAEGHTVEDAR